MKRLFNPVSNENGFALVIAMMIMIILTMLGIFATNTSIMELQISGNDRLAKEAFYRADGGTEAGIVLTEENMSCPNGFRSQFSPIRIGGVDVFEKDFVSNTKLQDINGAGQGVTPAEVPSDTVRSIRIPTDPANRSDTPPHTNLAVWSTGSELGTGSAIQMVSGYEGVGKGAASGGGRKLMKIASQHIGTRQTEAKIILEWRHVIGQEGTCNY